MNAPATGPARQILGIAGWSGAGKTTLLTRLIPRLRDAGLTVSTIKHAHHSFDIDRPGKDSFRHREAGASEVLITSANRMALMVEYHDRSEPTLAELVARLSPVDLILVEGFKFGHHPKIEIYRAALGKPPLFPRNRGVVALASDTEHPDSGLPCMHIDDIDAITRFIVAFQRAGHGIMTGTGAVGDDPTEAAQGS